MTPPYQSPGSPCPRNFRGFQFLGINLRLSMRLVLLGLRHLPAVLRGCWDLIFLESLQPWWEDFITLGIIHIPSLALAIAHSPPFLFQTCTRSQPFDFTLSELMYFRSIKCCSVSTAFARMKARNTPVYSTLGRLSLPPSLPSFHTYLSV